jgi:hypothetical protein
MKHSNTWFALILIASALLLSAARNTCAEPRSENHASKSERRSGDSNATSDPITTPINQPSAYSTSTDGGRITYNYNGDFKYAAPTPAPESGWKKFGDIANVASAIAVAFFTMMLWHVSRQQKVLAEQTEETAQRSVEVTRLAYLASRPYVTADEFVMKNFTTVNRLPDDAPPLTFMVVNFKLKNVGKGPAIIRIARAKLKIVSNDPEAWKFLPNPIDDWGDLSDCVPVPLEARVIPSDSSVLATTGFTPLPSEEEYKAIKMTYDQHIVIYGSLEYFDAAGEKYTAGFGVIYRPKGLLGENEFFSTGPAKYNPLI